MNLIIRPEQRKKTSLNFIALIPDRELRIKANAIKKDFKRFESSKATNVYTHITLKAPFKVSGIDRDSLLSWFYKIRLQQTPFHVYLNGFAAFHNKYNPVIYINPMPNRELIKMQRELMIDFHNILPAKVHPIDRSFKPHMTVAYRDLTPENFARAWKEYKDKHFYDVFDVHSIYLLEHDWQSWNIIATHKPG
ncbi:MAG TPA: 2'-5' RNA ligase family protein [Flavisolibacter sp.]|nr:2'-5' RNA ligase family protein [Flavisolibacter sp.]